MLPLIYAKISHFRVLIPFCFFLLSCNCLSVVVRIRKNRKWRVNTYGCKWRCYSIAIGKNHLKVELKEKCWLIGRVSWMVLPFFFNNCSSPSLVVDHGSWLDQVKRFRVKQSDSGKYLPKENFTPEGFFVLFPYLFIYLSDLSLTFIWQFAFISKI